MDIQQKLMRFKDSGKVRAYNVNQLSMNNR